MSPGLEYQRAIIDGTLPTPPFVALLGLRITSVAEDGATVCEATPRPEFANSAGRLHGGYLTALMDCVTATAAHSQQPAGVGVPHIHASYRFLSAADHRTPVVVTARPTHVGRSVVHAAAEIRDHRGTLIASGETIHKTRPIRRG
ncbi:PaaI family thioesterase [Actinophytocola gossypii]|uniref:PaaI family thioesterase n=1 Tax=Actinophytocola gossypii TaxID=2812003 RepID=A0ABT2J307_9PSEU|nr:PaaI family thioesterase [Actinophytocola gossypii]MCT2582242.1 PaaI family thioesterase [Actinophytocola gossypii]